MTLNQRQQHIMRLIRTHGSIRCADEARALGVSPMTIRRDVAGLAELGLVERVHGGAVANGQSAPPEPTFAVLPAESAGDKAAIARRAVEMVSPGDVIGIGGGSTTYAFAEALLASERCAGITVLTNSLPVANLVESLGSRDVEMILTGGVTTRFKSLIGPIADQAIASMRVATLFLGAHAVTLPSGFFTPNSLEASTDAAFIQSARRTVVLADHTKWANTSLSLFADFAAVDAVVTDDGLSPGLMDATIAAGADVLIA